MAVSQISSRPRLASMSVSRTLNATHFPSGETWGLPTRCIASMSSTVRPLAWPTPTVATVKNSVTNIVFATDMAASYHIDVPSVRVMSSRLLALFMAITVAACSSSSRRPRRPGQEYLAAIEMTGNTAIETDALVRGLSLDRARRGGRGIDEYQLSL